MFPRGNYETPPKVTSFSVKIQKLNPLLQSLDCFRQHGDQYRTKVRYIMSRIVQLQKIAKPYLLLCLYKLTLQFLTTQIAIVWH